jgi:hypothetical protein
MATEEMSSQIRVATGDDRHEVLALLAAQLVVRAARLDRDTLLYRQTVCGKPTRGEDRPWPSHI